jgi:hypothetical protein
MPPGGRRRRKRRSADFKAPPTRRSEREQEAAETRRPSSGSRSAVSVQRGRGRPRPPAPWGSFPLVELVVLLSLVLLIVGFVVQGTRGVTMIIAGITLGSLAGLELSVREHFSGYRSHTTVLAGAPAVLVLGVGFFLAFAPILNLVAGVTVFLIGFYVFREAFKRRSGGVGFRA